MGDSWPDRLACRQWGAHFPHVAGIAGQSTVGAQSVALSGGYEDDADCGEWFLYTGSGGRDLSGNKRTNKEQSFDQARAVDPRTVDPRTGASAAVYLRMALSLMTASSRYQQHMSFVSSLTKFKSAPITTPHHQSLQIIAPIRCSREATWL